MRDNGRRVVRRGTLVVGLLTATAAVASSVQALLERIAGTGENVTLGEPASVAEAVGSAAVTLTCLGALVLLLVASLRGRSSSAPRADIARLEEAASTDSLTGLGNRRAFQQDLSVEIRRRNATGSFFTLMAIDLDDLKLINDQRGHQAGDLFIKGVAEAIRRATGDEGVVYRTGGDEFMVLLSGRRNWDGLALAQRISQLTRASVGRRAVSIGLSESTGTETQQVVVHQADVALYEAKRTKLTAVTYHPGLAPGRRADDGHGPSRHQKTLAAALARAVDAKDVGTRSHSETVAQLSVAIGQRLGVDGDDLERLRLAGLLHDVGKIGVADAILQKRNSLAASEADEMKEHVTIGQAILASAELPIEAEWVLRHHERIDGAGYPAGLRGDEIPLQSRIIAVADAFEAMTGTRPYRARVSTDEAIAELERHSGTQFDGQCVAALVAIFAGTAVGSGVLGGGEPGAFDRRRAASLGILAAP